jgi:hypothetical protein
MHGVTKLAGLKMVLLGRYTERWSFFISKFFPSLSDCVRLLLKLTFICL